LEVKDRFYTNFLVFSLCLLTLPSFSQEEEEVDHWDHWFVLSNKVIVDGGEKWRHSHDLQIRLNNNVRSLERIMYEGAFTYSPNRKWDIVPDFRISNKPTEFEYRPGLGVVRKMYWGKDSVVQGNSLAHQIKYQADITSRETQHGVRYIVFYNHLVNDKFIIGGLGGGFYRWSENFTGIQFIRVGASFSWIFNEHNTLSIIEAIGFENRGEYLTYANFPMIQLIIRAKKDYKYRETLIFSF